MIVKKPKKWSLALIALLLTLNTGLIQSNYIGLSAISITSKCYAQSVNSAETAFINYAAAQINADAGEYKKYLSKKMLDDLNKEPNIEQIMTIGAAMAPKNITIKKATYQGDKAVLTVTGNFGFTGDFGTGEIRMSKEDGSWKVNTEKWQSNDKNGSATYTVGF